MILIKIDIQIFLDTHGKNVVLEDKKVKTIENLHPNYRLLRELSKRGTLDDDLIIRLQFF